MPSTAAALAREPSSAAASPALHQVTMDVLGAAGLIDWSRASVDTMHVRAVKGEI